MKLLLDTHIILWALVDNSRLPLEARTFIMDEKNDMIFITARHRSGRRPEKSAQTCVRCRKYSRTAFPYCPAV